MYKCKTENCNYMIKDHAVDMTNNKQKCPLCGNDFIYINELQLRIDKYKKSMFLNKK